MFALTPKCCCCVLVLPLRLVFFLTAERIMVAPRLRQATCVTLALRGVRAACCVSGVTVGGPGPGLDAAVSTEKFYVFTFDIV